MEHTNDFMDRNQILQAIRHKGTKGIKLPARIGFSINNKVLKIEIPATGLIQNMQHNDSAFEGWALCIKNCLKDLIDTVDIVWDVNAVPGENCHYKRFLYRIWKFTISYEWAICSNYSIIEKSLDGLIANIPLSTAKDIAENKEAILERQYIDDHKHEYDIMDQQLPVGLFNGDVCSSNRVTPSSFLDIWAIKDDTLHVFELKEQGNKTVGIISELMFYVNVMNDILKHRFLYSESADKVSYRNFEVLYNAYENRSINTIVGHLLTDVLHPLITQQVISLMNNSSFLNSEKVCYKHTLINPR